MEMKANRTWWAGHCSIGGYYWCSALDCLGLEFFWATTAFGALKEIFLFINGWVYSDLGWQIMHW